MNDTLEILNKITDVVLAYKPKTKKKRKSVKKRRKKNQKRLL